LCSSPLRRLARPSLDETVGTTATFGLFAVTFLIRPIGGMYFGPLADRIGRNKVLATTMVLMVLMVLGTFAIGCIPSEASIGLWAPILLLVARLVQGFSTGGEYGNADPSASTCGRGWPTCPPSPRWSARPRNARRR